MRTITNIMCLAIAAFAFASFALPPTAQAVSPAPDGGYAGFNTAEGQSALFSLTTGVANTAVGWFSLKSNTDGSFNTGIGAGTLLLNTGDQSTGEGVENTAVGAAALLLNTTGSENTAIGVAALSSNTTGNLNTATGDQALQYNTEGAGNTANGFVALRNNITGDFNTATGDTALALNTTGDHNTAAGAFALALNATADGNTAVGYLALEQNTDGSANTAVGESALLFNTGNNNTALGFQAGHDLTTGDNNIDIGDNVVGVAGESNTIRIGNTDITDTFIRGISGATISGGAQVFVNGNGKLGTMTSSSRFKDEIKPMGDASEAILALKPVSFRYKKEIDPQSIPQFGLVAEEVEKVNRALVVHDAKGKAQTVRYEQINAMLLNEFLKEHRQVQQLETNATLQQKEINLLRSELKEQRALIQRVNDKVELKSPARRTVANDAH
jgi:hypothetical protein